MAVTVENVTIWRKEVMHKPGELARALEPLAKAGADLKVIMAYAEKDRGIIEVGPISGKKLTDAAAEAGFAASTKPTLLIEDGGKPWVVAPVCFDDDRILRLLHPHEIVDGVALAARVPVCPQLRSFSADRRTQRERLLCLGVCASSTRLASDTSRPPYLAFHL